MRSRKECINTTLAELQGEQDGVKHLLLIKQKPFPLVTQGFQGF